MRGKGVGVGDGVAVGSVVGVWEGGKEAVAVAVRPVEGAVAGVQAARMLSEIKQRM